VLTVKASGGVPEGAESKETEVSPDHCNLEAIFFESRKTTRLLELRLDDKDGKAATEPY